MRRYRLVFICGDPGATGLGGCVPEIPALRRAAPPGALRQPRFRALRVFSFASGSGSGHFAASAVVRFSQRAYSYSAHSKINYVVELPSRFARYANG